MEDKFMTMFDKLKTLNVSLFLREKEIIETQNVISFLLGNNTVQLDPNKTLKTLKEYKKILKKLQKLQARENQIYATIRSEFLGLISKCDIDVLQSYAKELTKKEHKYKDDVESYEVSGANPVEAQRLRVVAKTYYDSIEAIYQYIDLKLQSSEYNKELKKTIK